MRCLSLPLSATALPWLLVGIVLAALSLVIVVRQRISPVANLFATMIGCVAVWFVAFSFFYGPVSEGGAEIAARAGLVAIALFPASIVHFTFLTLRKREEKRELLRLFWMLSTISAFLFLFTDLFVARVQRFDWGFYPVAEPGFLGFLLFFIGSVLLTIGLYIVAVRREEQKLRRRRLRELLASFAIVLLACIDFGPMLGASYRPIGYVPVILFLLFAWGGIRRHRLGMITVARASREIIDTMSDALIVVDSERRIRVINESVTRMFGHTSAELLGRPVEFLEAIDGDTTITNSLQRAVERGAVRDDERIFLHKNGDRIDVSVSISTVREGEMSHGAVLIARDIRERKRSEERLHAFAKRLQQSNRELEDFAYVASHDLQEPLRKIQAFGDRLRVKEAANLSEAGVDYIRRMQSAAGRMQGLINDLLSFSRVTTKAKPFVAIDLGEVVGEVIHDLEVRIHELGGKIDVGRLPVIEADPLQMRQIFQNLLSNALKFHRGGVPPEIRVEGWLDGAHGEDVECVVEVRDNGIGFEEKYAERIFTIFERLHGRGMYEGTGIGLAICRKIVERHGGTIEAHSAPGEGSRFVFRLPVKHSQEENLNEA